MNLEQLFNCEEEYKVVFDNNDLTEISEYLSSHFSGFEYITLVRLVDRFIIHYELSVDFIAAGVKDGEFQMEWAASLNTRSDFLLTRALLLRDDLKVAVHRLFVLPIVLQGRGLARIILKSFYQQYIASGVDRIELIAGKYIGGYAWAVYGFYATDSRQVCDIIELGRARSSISFEETELHLKIFSDYYNTKPSTMPFPMRDIAASPGGKALLRHTEWNAILDLRNDLQRELFETYLGITL